MASRCWNFAIELNKSGVPCFVLRKVGLPLAIYAIEVSFFGQEIIASSQASPARYKAAQATSRVANQIFITQYRPVPDTEGLKICEVPFECV